MQRKALVDVSVRTTSGRVRLVDHLASTGPCRLKDLRRAQMDERYAISVRGLEIGFPAHQPIGRLHVQTSRAINEGGADVIQMGAGDGGGVEVSVASDPNSFGVSGAAGPRGALGAYGAFGKQYSFNYSTPQLGCE